MVDAGAEDPSRLSVACVMAAVEIDDVLALPSRCSCLHIFRWLHPQAQHMLAFPNEGLEVPLPVEDAGDVHTRARARQQAFGRGHTAWV